LGFGKFRRGDGRRDDARSCSGIHRWKRAQSPPEPGCWERSKLELELEQSKLEQEQEQSKLELELEQSKLEQEQEQSKLELELVQSKLELELVQSKLEQEQRSPRGQELSGKRVLVLVQGECRSSPERGSQLELGC